MRTVRIVAWWVAALAAVGCGGGDERAAAFPDVTPIDTRPITLPEDDELLRPLVPREGAGEGAGAAFEGGTGVTEKKRPGMKPAVLRAVRAARNEGFDRVVFELAGDAVPGYHVQYVDGPSPQCGSGKATIVAGNAWIEVRMSPAQAHTDAGKVTIADRERKTKLDVLEEIELSCDFEGQVTWVLGVAARNRYRVMELSRPARLVVDVQR